MRLSDAPDLKLQQLADGHRLIASRIDPLIFEELIDRRAAMTPVTDLELSFAYLHARGIITDGCAAADHFSGDVEWYDAEAIDELVPVEDVQDAIAYLTSRKLLLTHPSHATWVAICDEEEA
jgi:hypothetical protein